MIFWSSPEKWEPNKVFCPGCGKNETVWNETSGGDDLGPNFLCVDCKCEFCLPEFETEPTEDIGYEAKKAKLISSLRERTRANENGVRVVEVMA